MLRSNVSSIKEKKRKRARNLVKIVQNRLHKSSIDPSGKNKINRVNKSGGKTNRITYAQLCWILVCRQTHSSVRASFDVECIERLIIYLVQFCGEINSMLNSISHWLWCSFKKGRFWSTIYYYDMLLGLSDLIRWAWNMDVLCTPSWNWITFSYWIRLSNRNESLLV